MPPGLFITGGMMCLGVLSPTERTIRGAGCTCCTHLQVEDEQIGDHKEGIEAGMAVLGLKLHGFLWRLNRQSSISFGVSVPEWVGYQQKSWSHLHFLLHRLRVVLWLVLQVVDLGHACLR